jgi:site-specific DNA-methyltransferase (adenine-specific)/modification methylase
MSSRVEHIGNATLYLGDCLEILPVLGPVDAVVTDPPYGLGKLFSGGGWARKSAFVQNNDRVWDEINPEAVYRLIDLQVPSIIWGGNNYELPPQRGWLVWEKDGAGTAFTLGHGELAWTNIKQPIRFFKHPRHKATGKHAPVHGTQKPVSLMKWCLNFLPKYAAYSQIVLDPFMGSGTTGVACAELGRKFIGIEIDPKYFDIACKRIEDAYKQGDLFVEPPAKAVQKSFEMSASQDTSTATEGEKG